MEQIGFSTGSLAKGDFNRAIKMLKGKECNAIEISALRDYEFKPLMRSLDSLDLRQYSYVAIHAPAKFVGITEEVVASNLLEISKRGWHIIIHPDAIKDFNLWKPFGESLCLENMDKRKTIGRTTSELQSIFRQLPNASFCLDLGHIRQVDPTMNEAITMCSTLGDRIKQIHVSDVNSSSGHEPLSLEAIIAFNRISNLLSKEIPVILESPVQEEFINSEIKFTKCVFDQQLFKECLSLWRIEKKGLSNKKRSFSGSRMETVNG